jgi:hypothetical protein
MATHYLLNTALSSLDKNGFVMAYCVTYKRPSIVNHDILLAKLEFRGISGIANKLMKSYLNSR